MSTAKIDHPASTIPALEIPEIVSGSVPPADGGIAARTVQDHARVPVPMSAMVPECVRIIREQIAIDANSPQAVADRAFISELIEACETSGGINVFDRTGQVARDNKTSAAKIGGGRR